MRTLTIYLSILIAALSIASCENDLPFDFKENPPKLVMNALINADSLTNTVFLNLTGKDNVAHIQDATLEVRVNGELTQQLRPLPIESENVIPQCRFGVTGKLSPGDVLRLDALTDDGKYHAWAEVTVPCRPAEIENIDTLTISLTSGSYTSSYLRHKITFSDLPDENNYYRIIMDSRVIHSRPIYDDPPVIEWHNFNFVCREDVVLTDGQPSTEDDEDYGMFDKVKNVYGVFDDSRFKNSPYTMTVHVPKYILQGFNIPYLDVKVDIIVHLLSITETEFYYLKALNLIDSDSYDETINEPIKYPSNVNGGTGIVGVSTEVSKIIHIIDSTKSTVL